MITAKNLTKTYVSGEIVTPVLKGIDMDIKKGEFVAIMGKSGAGKSTLLYQISLLDIPTEGRIIVANTDILNLSESDRTKFRLKKLGYIFQDYALVPELTAEENVAIPLLMQGIPHNDAIQQARKIIDSIDMAGKYTNRPNQLSGGQQQRISIARAIVQSPEILFADEPTANLDSASSEQVIELMRDLHVKGQTIVMVTHEPEYTKYCDRIIYLDDGKIISHDYKIQ
ncbi:ABC transporter [Candidatus Campbellbacteria bacterium]|nr:ABC transporter [Candidatus Campbellbacteria bacterium]|tara:strand:- start:1871 stop:2551 length:681 start_codon:yes stop_codon:yes gene_type:complete